MVVLRALWCLCSDELILCCRTPSGDSVVYKEAMERDLGRERRETRGVLINIALFPLQKPGG